MAKISILLENGSNTISLTQESNNLDALRESIISCMNIVLIQKPCDFFTVEIGELRAEEIDNSGFRVSNRIKGIKAIRTVTNLNLRPAKDICDRIMEGAYDTLPVAIHKDNKEEANRVLSEMFNYVKFIEKI